MTIVPGDGSYAYTPVQPKRMRLSLKYNQQHPSSGTSQQSTSSSGSGQQCSSTQQQQPCSSMDSMTGITAFFPSNHRLGPFTKYDAEPSRSSTTDDSPVSEGTSSSERNPPVIATLANMGNTCFLNSVLYTLRFVPQFMHQLHHVVTELGSVRRAAEDEVLTRPQLTQLAVERLHELYQALRGNEDSRYFEALQPSIFLNTFREVNPSFETHQQHDAHELLMSVLDNVRETCEQLRLLRERRNEANLATAVRPEPGPSQQPSGSKGPATRSGGFKTPWSKGKKGKGKSKIKKEIKEEPKDEEEAVPPQPGAAPLPEAQPNPNFIARDFEGEVVLRTTCRECESFTERRETFSDVGMAIKPPDEDEEEVRDASSVFHETLLSSEPISGPRNKYWCESCQHLNEASRRTSYPALPRVLTIHLKRFSSSFGSIFSVSKVNDFLPTPLTLRCFCEECHLRPPLSPALHSYQLFAAIMHVGSTMASGHYVAYVRATDNVLDYCGCETHLTSCPSPAPPPTGILRFLKPKVEKGVQRSYLGPDVCPGTDCCGIRLSLEQGADPAVPEQCWFECDDENVNVLSRAELEEVLSEQHAKSTSLTPYLLFYLRSDLENP